MKLNTISFLCLILVIFTVAGVNASDVNDTVVASDVNDDVISNAEQIEEISVSDDGNLITDTPKTMTVHGQSNIMETGCIITNMRISALLPL